MKRLIFRDFARAALIDEAALYANETSDMMVERLSEDGDVQLLVSESKSGRPKSPYTEDEWSVGCTRPNVRSVQSGPAYPTMAPPTNG
mmetsp:Transcript_14280/g.24893  ORF Transcript_14280/g.24893 Transcript_14280/m.24893 type:complete len:88 (+) Transcript_14280:1188-1451(+)